ncbi:ATP-binding protein [Flammeovirga sp. SubArs3]|uniref:ATP-binding protein n=1 Tax=Flammeovirga sp. SubArs3 TaxID=2995316 RepID=UPI00248B394C|nr:ATP-binding protein [Flammeovirga sp. SubArs3]
MKEKNYCQANPNPEYLIKSIAEQGYTLDTALADLLDNSISAEANKIEIITDTSSSDENMRLYLTDNGYGMTESELEKNMHFPSSLMEANRNIEDLGRFGLGLKTASFSQTRKFTVLSRKKGTDKFYGRTWDVDYLKQTQEWRMIINSSNEVETLLKDYNRVLGLTLNQFNDYQCNTIIIWDGLRKFQNIIDPSKRAEALKNQLTFSTSEYLGIVFHKFIENGLKIRINNIRVEAFDPFNSNEKNGIRSLGRREREFGEDVLGLEGFVLPNQAIRDENIRTRFLPQSGKKGLLDLEGIYIYRGNRIIYFGGWNGLIKKSSRLQLARMMIDVENVNDDLLHLNVAKSQITIPFDLRRAVETYLEDLTKEAHVEYYNYGSRKRRDPKEKELEFIERQPSSKGAIYKVNLKTPLVNDLLSSLNDDQEKLFKKVLLAMNSTMNQMRNLDDKKDSAKIIEDEELEFKSYYHELINSGLSHERAIRTISRTLGVDKSLIII